MELKKAREKIDEVDDAILASLKKRFEIVKEIGLLKKKEGIPIHDPEREKEMFSRFKEHALLYSLDSEFIENLWNVILKESREIQEGVEE